MICIICLYLCLQQTIPPPQAAQTQPAIMQPSNEPPPYTESSAQRVNTDDLQKRQEVNYQYKQALQVSMAGIKIDPKKKTNRLLTFQFSLAQIYFFVPLKKEKWNTVYLGQSLREAEAIENLINNTYKSLRSKFKKQILMHMLQNTNILTEVRCLNDSVEVSVNRARKCSLPIFMELIYEIYNYMYLKTVWSFQGLIKVLVHHFILSEFQFSSFKF